MAKPEIDVIVKVFTKDSIDVWATSGLDEILLIEGVVEVHNAIHLHSTFVICDPRYDVEEIAREIRELLTAEVPEVFKE